MSQVVVSIEGYDREGFSLLRTVEPGPFFLCQIVATRYIVIVFIWDLLWPTHCQSPVAKLYEKYLSLLVEQFSNLLSIISPTKGQRSWISFSRTKPVLQYSYKSPLTPYPEVAAPKKVLIGNFLDEIVFFAC